MQLDAFGATPVWPSLKSKNATPTTRLPGGFTLLAGRVDPQAIAGHALEATGAEGIGCVFAEED